jgi:hypothetical protein
MRPYLLLFGLLAASPAFAQSSTGTPSGGGLGNYNLSGSYGGKSGSTSIHGNGEASDMKLGGSSLGNGNVGTSYGTGSLNAGSGISVDGSGFSNGMSSLPAAGGGTSRPVPNTDRY